MQGLIALCNPIFQFSIEGFNFPLRIFQFSIEGFFRHPCPPLTKRGSLIPNQAFPFSKKGKDVAGYAIASPEFWYRQQSLCPYGAGDDFLRNRVAIVLRLIGDFCAVLHRLHAGLALCSKLSSRLCSKLPSRLCSKLSTRRFTPHKKSQLCCVKQQRRGL